MQPTSAQPSPEQEFPYGWRYVKQILPDGSETLDQVALTLEDVLHPQQDDVIPQTPLHADDCAYLTNVFRTRPLSPPEGLVTHDLLIDWGVPGIRSHSPDLAVFVGLIRPHDPNLGILDLAGLGGRCELAVEVVSPLTRINDLVAKLEHYHRIGIPLYVIIDQEKQDSPRKLRAFRHQPDRYVEIEADDQGRIEVPLLGLMLGMRDNRVVCYDLHTGREFRDYAQAVRDLEEVKRRIEEADRRATERQQAIEEQVKARQAAERRARELRSEADRYREETARHLEKAARYREDTARLREKAARYREDTARYLEEADRLRQAREQAENDCLAQAQRIRELEELLGRVQGGGPASPAT
jgi:hypothetical protein